MIKTAPNPVDIQDLQFKLHCRLKIFDNATGTGFVSYCNLVSCASRFGLIFVGTNSPTVQAIQLKDIEQFSKDDDNKANYARRILPLPSEPTHLCVNCEHTTLAIVIEKDNTPYALFYDVKSFYTEEIIKVGEVCLSLTTSVQVTEINWNPTIGSTFTACKSDGSLGVYEIKNTGIEINELPAAAGATSFCWSPKGKQIAIGSRDGKITQLKPDLKAVKVINAPSLKEPHALQSLQWVSNYQFIGIFQSLNPGSHALFIVVDAPKTGEPTYTNYDDICYSNGNTRPTQFYTILLHSWNILMAASSNSMEVGVMGVTNDCWTQWIIGDSARAELPLSTNHQETLPIGCALDIGRTQPIPWGESTILPPPFLLLYSHHGILCFFNVINLKSGTPTLCTPPDPISNATGLQHFVPGSDISKQTSKVEYQKLNIPKVDPPKTVPATVIKPQNNQVNTSQPEWVKLFGGATTITPVTQASKSQSPYLPQYQCLLPTITASTTVINVAQTDLKTVETEIVASTLKDNEEEKIFAQMVKEECIFLESQVKAMLHQGKGLKFHLGSDDDKTKIVTDTKTLEDFLKEIAEICITQNSEVHILKQNLLQSWAWYEEAKSRHLLSEDESMLLLIRAQPLDSASEKQLADIQHMNYYLESQISQAHAALDEQWEHFQDYCKKTHKIQIPTMEMIFQTLVKQNAILQKQRYILKDIGSKIKIKSRSGLTSLFVVNDLQELPSRLKRLQVNPENVYQIHHEQIVKRQKSFPNRKVDRLRSFLQKRECPHVAVLRPQLSTSIIQASPVSKLKNSLMSPMATPAVEELPKKKLNFVQSTPITSEASTFKVQSSTPIEGLQNFALKFGADNFNDKGKSLLGSSPNSAFVSASNLTTSKPTLTNLSNVSSMKATQFAQPVSSAQSKPFTFTSASDSSKSGLFSTSTAIPTFNFNAQSIASKTPLFSNSSTTTATVLPSAKLMTTTSTVGNTSTALTGFSFGTVSSPSIFSATTKPFSFSEKTIQSDSPTTVQRKLSFSQTTSISTSNAKIQPTFGATTIKSSASTITSATSDSTKSSTSIFASTTAQSSFSLSEMKLFTTTATTTPVTAATSCLLGLPSTSTKTSAAAVTMVTNIAVGFLPATATTTTKTSIFGSIDKPTLFVSSTASSPINLTTTSTEASKVTTITLPPTATTQSSIFATAVSTTSFSTIAAPVSIFSGATTSKPSIFAVSSSTSHSTVSPKPSIFGTPTSQTTAATTASIFGTVSSTTNTTTATPSIFDTATNTTTATTSKPSVFGTPTTTTSQCIFGDTSSSSPTKFIFGTAITSSKVQESFGDPTQTVFTSTATSSNQSGSGFGTNIAPTITQNTFGNNTATPPSFFGTSTTSSSSQTVFGSTTGTTQSIFGSSTTPSTTQSVFGANTTTTQPLFGSPAASKVPAVFGSTTTSSIFGSGTPTTSATQSQSIFGSPSTTQLLFGTTNTQVFDTSTSQPAFGSTTPATFGSSAFGDATTQPSIFGAQTSGSFGNTSNVFDQNQTANTFGQGSVFGSTGGSTFGASPSFAAAAPTFGQSSPSVFGSASTTSSSVFGSASGGSVFGAPASTSSTPFGTSAFSNTGQSNAFSSSSNQGSFGFGSLSVGATATTSSGFGSTQNPFAGENKNVFGSPISSSGSIFGSNSGSAFGRASQTFGGSTGGFGQSTFGQQSVFGQNASFGSSTFGQQSPGPFSGGNTESVNQTGFGAGNIFQKPAFGSSPIFGGQPAFGSAPSFGGAPAFGSPPSFGGGLKVFGGSNGGGFASASNTPSAGFGNLANQQTVGFGNLAQQAASGGSSSRFSGNSSFSSWR